MDIPKFKIGQIAEMFGITPESIRHYERKGLISPVEKVNTYRYYDWIETAKISAIRTLLSYGFNLNEVKDLLYPKDLNHMADSLEEKAREIENDIQEKMKLLQAIRVQKAQIYRSTQRIKPSLCQYPETYRVNVYTNRDLVDVQENYPLISCMLDLQPYSSIYFLMNKEDIENNGYAKYCGISIPCKEWNRLMGRPDPSFEYVKEETAIHTMMKKSSVDNGKKELQEVLSFAQEHGYRITGDVILHRTAFQYHEDDVHYWFEAWFPVEKKKE